MPDFFVSPNFGVHECVPNMINLPDFLIVRAHIHNGNLLNHGHDNDDSNMYMETRYFRGHLQTHAKKCVMPEPGICALIGLGN